VRFQQREQHRAAQDVLVVCQLRDDIDDRTAARDRALVGRAQNNALDG
jgi:hypothetical protein